MAEDSKRVELEATRPDPGPAQAHFLANRDTYWDSVGRHLDVLRGWLQGERGLAEPEVKIAVEGAVALCLGEWAMREGSRHPGEEPWWARQATQVPSEVL